MNNDLLEQLAEYGSATRSARKPVMAASVRDRSGPIRSIEEPHIRAKGPRWYVAVAAAAATVAALGTVALLADRGGDNPAADETPVSVTQPATTIAPPTTAPPTTVAVPLPLVFSSLETIESDLGTFVWTRIDGDVDTLPMIWNYATAGLAIEIDAEGNYVSWDFPLSGPPNEFRVWSSPDALTWTFEYTDTDTPPTRFSRVAGPLVVDIPAGGFGLFDGLDTHFGDRPLADALVSGDGTTWETIRPTFVTEEFKGAQVWRSEHRLEANVYSSPNVYERWTSLNGTEWTRDYRYPADLLIAETKIGLVAYGVERYAISIDNGTTWTFLPIPPDMKRSLTVGGTGSGSITPGAFDDFVFLRMDSGKQRTFWIGRFEGN